MAAAESEGEGRSVLAERCPRPPVTLFHLKVGGARPLVRHCRRGTQRPSAGRREERGRGRNLHGVWRTISLVVFKRSFPAATLLGHRSTPRAQHKGQGPSPEGNDGYQHAWLNPGVRHQEEVMKKALRDLCSTAFTDQAKLINGAKRRHVE